MEQLPDQTINRLPVYRCCLTQARKVGIAVINSLQLAQMAGTNAAQVRKDLSYLGELGKRGIGYDVDGLIRHLSEVLGLTEKRRVAIVGYGHLGGALRGYDGLETRGFEIVAIYDNDPAKVGTQVGEIVITSMDDIERGLRERGVEIVILTTPTTVAQEVAERVVAAGVRAIMSFTCSLLDLPDDVHVRPVDLSVELQVLSFYLARRS